MEETLFHGNAYSNSDYLPICFKPGEPWLVRESHYFNDEREDIPFENGERIHTNLYETPVYFNLYNQDTTENMNCMVTIRKFDTEIIEYGQPKIGSHLTITYQDDKTTSICQAFYKDHPTDKVKKSVITGPHLECLGRKHTIHFDTIYNLVRQLNRAFWSESCSVDGNRIIIRLPKMEHGKYNITIRNGNGMHLVE